MIEVLADFFPVFPFEREYGQGAHSGKAYLRGTHRLDFGFGRAGGNQAQSKQKEKYSRQAGSNF
jgi:hypothetical protein